MLVMNQKEMLNEIDRMNADSFKYIGIWHHRSGYRPEVQAHEDFIKKLGVEPIKEIKIRFEKSKSQIDFEKYAICIDISSAFVNIYDYESIKTTIEKRQTMSKEKCLIMLNYEG